MKKILSIVLSLMIITSHCYNHAAFAATYEYAMFPMTYLNISQGVNGSFSHQGTNAIDITGKDAGIDTAYAPFTGVIKRIYQGYVIWLESSQPVIFADGTIDYMTVMLMHDNDTSDLYVGKKINQGERFFEEGTAGYATGNHIHLECSKGKFQGNGWYKNTQGQWMIYNSIVPYNALHISSDTIIKNDYGYNWKQNVHTHNYNSYVYYGASHPHYKYYKCSCGEVKANYSETTFVSTCTTCNPPVTYDDIQPGNYFIRNKSNDTYLNIAYGEDANSVKIHTHEFGNWDSQVYNIYVSNNGYAMKPLSSKTRVVNIYTTTVVSGKTVCLYDETGHDSQLWKFQPLNGGYVIRNVQNPSVCISPSSSGLIVSEYAGKDYQIWCLEKACNINFDANGGSFEYKTQRTRAGYNTVLLTNSPTKSGGYRFMGWSTNKNDYYATYIAGQHITINDDLNLYAIWRKCTHEYSNPNETICSDCGLDKTKCNGDVDNSGATTLDDVVALAQVVAGWQNVAHNAAALDVDGNGSVTLDDVVLLAQYVAGWGVTLN